MGQEIERKFLVVGTPWENAPEAPQHLVQGYLPLADGQAGELRVRVERSDAGGAAWLTIKSEGGLVRQETEVAIAPEMGERLLGEAGPHLVEKKRYRLPVGSGLTAEVDVYEGALQGLVVAEIELPSETTLLPSLPWLGDEVTEDKTYKNKALATKGWPASAPARPRAPGMRR